MYGETFDLNVSISNGNTGELNGIFAAKLDFPIGHFMLLLLMLTPEVLSVYIQYWISIQTTCW